MQTLVTFLFLFALTILRGQSTGSPLEINHLTGDFFIYTTYDLYKGERTPANGMYLITSKGAVIIDSPWDSTQYQPLLDSIQARHHTTAVLCIATHFHGDRTGGLQYYRQKGIHTYTTKKTDALSKKRGMKRAEFLIDQDTVFTVGQYSVQTYYPGHGHAPDNIVIWFEKEKILYGGCLVKSVEDANLGNLGDASKKDYATTLKNVQKKCLQPNYIIPGHAAWRSTKALEHTLQMAEKLR